MIILESILLWAVAGDALLLIMQYVMKSPQTPSRPEFGLGKRYQIGPQEVVENRPRRKRREAPVMDMAPPAEPMVARRRRRTVEQPIYQELVHEPAGEQPTVQRPVEQQVVAQQVQQAEAEPFIQEAPVSKQRNKKRTDTMQLMLNKAMAERG